MSRLKTFFLKKSRQMIATNVFRNIGNIMAVEEKI